MSGSPTIIPISDLRQNTAGVTKRAALSHEPVVITQHGRSATVVVDAQTYERTPNQLQTLQLLAVAPQR
jgi:prevent-host-death family protein